jgi:hypothetical protein
LGGCIKLLAFVMSVTEWGRRLMVYWIVIHGVQFVLDMLSVARLLDEEKDIEILLLRQQLWIISTLCIICIDDLIQNVLLHTSIQDDRLVAQVRNLGYFQ